MDTIGQFLEERTQTTENLATSRLDSYRLKVSDLYHSYKTWAEDNGYNPKGSKSFSQAIKQRGFESTRVGTARGFAGIRLLSTTELMDLNREIQHDEGARIN